jgi:hypothetical protein
VAGQLKMRVQPVALSKVKKQHPSGILSNFEDVRIAQLPRFDQYRNRLKARFSELLLNDVDTRCYAMERSRTILSRRSGSIRRPIRSNISIRLSGSKARLSSPYGWGSMLPRSGASWTSAPGRGISPWSQASSAVIWSAPKCRVGPEADKAGVTVMTRSAT